MGDFNLNWLLSVSGGFKSVCDTYNLFQLVDKPTRPNSKFPEKIHIIRSCSPQMPLINIL